MSDGGHYAYFIWCLRQPSGEDFAYFRWHCLRWTYHKTRCDKRLCHTLWTEAYRAELPTPLKTPHEPSHNAGYAFFAWYRLKWPFAVDAKTAIHFHDVILDWWNRGDR
jgi:hypothetical protein